MAIYNYQEIDDKINILNNKIGAAFQSNLVRRAAYSTNKAGFFVQQSEKDEIEIFKAAESAAKEIKEYVTQIWNDNNTREETLEKLQDELNKNMRFLAEERRKLECYIAKQKNILEKEKGLEESMGMVINQLEETERKLQEVYEVYSKANEKGWKIIFYPALAFEALKYTIEKKDKVLEEQRRNRIHDYDKLFFEQKEYLRQQSELDRDIRRSINRIAEAETTLIMQKMELGRLKEMIVKGSKAFIYYSMLEEKIRLSEDYLAMQEDFGKNIEKVSVTQKELEELLEIWKKNKNDSEAVYRILQRMFNEPIYMQH